MSDNNSSSGESKADVNKRTGIVMNVVSHNKFGVVSLSIISVALICIIGFLFLKFDFVVKGEKIRRVEACDSEVVTRWNQVLTSFERDSEAELAIIKDIESREGYFDNATCVYIGIRYYLRENNIERATEYYARYDELVNDGEYASGKLYDAMAIVLLEQQLKNTNNDGEDISPIMGEEDGHDE
jgi:hypothetical protein